VITIGRRLSMVALRIRAQSGGRTRIALLNAAPRADFDLIVAACAQHRDPRRATVVRLGCCCARRSHGRDAVADALACPVADLPRPLTALLVGGPTKPVIFDAVARTPAAAAAKVVGSPAAARSCRRAAHAAGSPTRWPPRCRPTPRGSTAGKPTRENPYRRCSGLADGFIDERQHHDDGSGGAARAPARCLRAAGTRGVLVLVGARDRRFRACCSQRASPRRSASHCAVRRASA
jgi:mitochondrial fission protein ELM1